MEVYQQPQPSQFQAQKEPSPYIPSPQPSTYYPPQGTQQKRTSTQTQPQPTVVAPTKPVSSGGGGCRSNARLVALIDIIISLIAIIIGIVGLLIFISLIEFFQSRRAKGLGFLYTLAFFSALVVVCNSLELCIACSLMSAADKGTHSLDAVGRAQFWVYYNMFLVLLSVIHGGMGLGYSPEDSTGQLHIGHLLIFVLRIIAVCVVYNFVHELRTVGSSSVGRRGNKVEAGNVGGVQEVTTPTTPLAHDDIQDEKRQSYHEQGKYQPYQGQEQSYYQDQPYQQQQYSQQQLYQQQNEQQPYLQQYNHEYQWNQQRP